MLFYFYSTNILWELLHISLPCHEWVCLCTSCFLDLGHPASSCFSRLWALLLVLSVVSSRSPWWIGGQVLSVWWQMDVTSPFYCLTRAPLIASFLATLHAICSPEGQNTTMNHCLCCSVLAGYVVNICLLTNLPFKQKKGMICPCCACNLILLPPSGQKINIFVLYFSSTTAVCAVWCILLTVTYSRSAFNTVHTITLSCDINAIKIH